MAHNGTSLPIPFPMVVCSSLGDLFIQRHLISPSIYLYGLNEDEGFDLLLYQLAFIALLSLWLYTEPSVPLSRNSNSSAEESFPGTVSASVWPL
ncbi:hypothetical protein AAFF_G00215100 [Aldrovandia affinis]|uniref:Uncharacterized protein n=1 Tax=Aldrovandia affinis TaxID=143900 RepID=A0AAD7RJ61_9TELE|nr:hypothetical protein AAFF_G00215100 [Aldrovandia affinis]